jgi:ribonuclease BN (tRNA processing enzyme)
MKDVQLIALGTGSAFSMKNWQTNFLLQVTDEHDKVHRLLIDCGSDVRFSLRDVGLSYLDIDAVYVSHAHADHVGGMEYLGFCTYFDKRYSKNRLSGIIVGDTTVKPTLFCERNLLRSVWDNSLRGGMEGIEGVDATIATYFNPVAVDRNKWFTFAGLDFDIVQSVHVSAKYCIVDSFGLMFTDPVNCKRVYITTDVQFAPETSMMAYYKEADIVIHDCETSSFASGVHAHYENLKTLKPEIKGKMRLIHYQDNVLDNWGEWSKKAIDDGFHGFTQKGIIYSSEE